MRFDRTLLSLTLILAMVAPCMASTRSHRGPTSSRFFHKHSKKKSATRVKGQRTIDDARAAQIQTSLIKSGYLSGVASGHWDSATAAAMQRYQGDNGWQTKLIPDSRAIIKLGLGPAQDSASNVNSSSAAGLPSSSSGFLQK
jgi:hypothetical protein